MSFLAPFFLLGSLAIALPVVFHLIRRTTREKTPFSSLMFLVPSSPRLTRRSRLENILLLALRCLVLGLLALGFARPFIKEAVSNEPTSAGGRRIVILVDRSASMRRANLWPDALAKAQSILRQTSPADQVAVFTFDREMAPLMTFEQWNAAAPGERAALAGRRLAETSPGWAATQVGNALINAAELLADTGGKAASGPRQIMLLSDMQEGCRLEQLQGYEWPRGIEVVNEALKAKHRGNAGLQMATESEDIAPKAEASVRVQVSNARDSTVEQFKVGWAVPDGRSFSGKPLEVYVPPGQSRIVAVPMLMPAGSSQTSKSQGPASQPEGEIRKPSSAGPVPSQIILQGDEEDFDNTVFVLPPAQARLTVLYLGRDSQKDAHQPLYFLERAFQETRGQAVQVLVNPADKPLLGNQAQGASLLIATEALPEESARVLREQVTAGKTLLMALKNEAAASTLARVLGVERLGVQEAQSKNYAMLGEIDFRHPLFASFADPRFSDFTKIHFWKHRQLNTAELPGSRVLAKFDSGDPAILEVPVGKGRVLVFASGWHPEDSQLALSTKFVPLLYAILEASGASGPLPAQYYVGDNLPLGKLRTDAQDALSIRAPDGLLIALKDGETNFSQTLTPGIYSLVSARATTISGFAVNVDAAESRTAPGSADELERLGAPLARSVLVPAVEAARKARLQNNELENRQKLWRWFITGTLGVLMAETWLAGRTARAVPVQGGVTA